MLLPMYAVVAGNIQTVIAPLLNRVVVAVRVYFDRITCTEWHVLLGKETLGETLCPFCSCIRGYKFAHSDEIIAIVDTFLMPLVAADQPVSSVPSCGNNNCL